MEPWIDFWLTSREIFKEMKNVLSNSAPSYAVKKWVIKFKLDQIIRKKRPVVRFRY